LQELKKSFEIEILEFFENIEFFEILEFFEKFEHDPFIYGQRAIPTIQESKELGFFDKEVLTLIIGNGSVTLNKHHESYLLSAKKLELLGFYILNGRLNGTI
jgi:hypothetical protein